MITLNVQITEMLTSLWLVVIIQSHSHRQTQIITEMLQALEYIEIFIWMIMEITPRKGRLAEIRFKKYFFFFVTSASCIQDTVGSLQVKLLSSNRFKCITLVCLKILLYLMLYKTQYSIVFYNILMSFHSCK